MACPVRADGLRAGVRRVQAAPSNCQVSSVWSPPASEVTSTALLPSVIIRPVVALYEPGGVTAAARWVQVVPSQLQVSPSMPLPGATPS